jgi:hypothetical protein
VEEKKMKNMEISKYVVSNADECKRLQESVDFLMREVKITGKGSLECRAS